MNTGGIVCGLSYSCCRAKSGFCSRVCTSLVAETSTFGRPYHKFAVALSVLDQPLHCFFLFTSQALFGGFADACIRSGHLKLLWKQFKNLLATGKPLQVRQTGPWANLMSLCSENLTGVGADLWQYDEGFWSSTWHPYCYLARPDY